MDICIISVLNGIGGRYFWQHYFLLIPTLGKSGLTLLLMTFQTTPVRTQPFVHFILPRIHLQTRHNSCRIFRKIETKDVVPALLNLTAMSHHTSVSNCFYYVITIALSVNQIVWYKYLCFNLNPSSIHLWRM